MDTFTKGQQFKIIEINGTTAEAGHIYDAAARLRDVYPFYFRRLNRMFAISAANYRRGYRPASLKTVIANQREIFKFVNKGLSRNNSTSKTKRDASKHRCTIRRTVLRFLYKSGLITLSFYAGAFIWHRAPSQKKQMTITDVHHLFYVDFLKVPPDKMEITKQTENSITTLVSHDCPILKMAGIIDEDTRKMCQKVSKGPCNYFIRKLGTSIRIENDYYHIRPHFPTCRETISILN